MQTEKPHFPREERARNGAPVSYPVQSSWSDSLLAADGGGDAGFAGAFLEIVELLFGVVDGFLFVGDLLFVLGVLLVPVAGVAHAVAGVGVHGGGANLVLAL